LSSPYIHTDLWYSDRCRLFFLTRLATYATTRYYFLHFSLSLYASFSFRYIDYNAHIVLSMVKYSTIAIKFFFFLMNILHRLIPESRRWYLNSHRVSRVNKLLQICSSKPTPTLGLNKIGSTTPNTITYDKPMISQESEHVQKSSISWLFIEKQLRIITCCLFTLWYENTILNEQRYIVQFQVYVIFLLSMYVFSIDFTTSNNELCTDEFHRIFLVYPCIDCCF
jgi:hypothetical protein